MTGLSYEEWVSELMSVRLAAKMRRAVYRIARATRRTQSDVVREAIEEYVARRPVPERPYDAWREIIGIAKGLPADLSERTGEKVRKLLEARRKRRP
jgi:predicted transcriptional regulator